MKRTFIVDIICILFMILFLYTSVNKMMEYSVFKEQISESPILAPISMPIAAGLPIIEMLLTIMLLIPRWRLIALYASLVMMTLFTMYVIAILLFDKNLPCSCGGILAALSWPQHLIFNITFIIFAIAGIWLEKKSMRQNNTYSTWNSTREAKPRT